VRRLRVVLSITHEESSYRSLNPGTGLDPAVEATRTGAGILRQRQLGWGRFPAH
jgi:hypothetical protein